MADKKEVKARALVAFEFDGMAYKPDQLVSLPAAVIATLKADGAVDDDKAAVTYAASLKGAAD